MIPATESVACFDPATGERRVYDRWTLERFSISRNGEGAASCDIVVRRCRMLSPTETETLSDEVAGKIGKQASLSLNIANIFEADGENYPPSVLQLVGPVKVGIVGVVAAIMNARKVR
jgi:hypothetical protein